MAKRLRFMSEDHHRLRDFAVQELARTGAPLPVAGIAEALDLDLSAATQIIVDLEQHLTFLYRSRPGAVSWAYPMTVEDTGHRAHFSTGEDAYSP